jgi:hypothetical protein
MELITVQHKCLNSLLSSWTFAYREEVKPKIGGNAKEGENKLHLGVQAEVDHFSGSLEPERSTTNQPYNDQCTQRFCGGSNIVDAGTPMLKSQLFCKADRTWLRSDADVSQKIMPVKWVGTRDTKQKQDDQISLAGTSFEGSLTVIDGVRELGCK